MTDTPASANAPGPSRPVVRQLSLLKGGWSRFAENRTAAVAAILFALLAGCAIFAPWLVPQDPYDLASLSILDARLPPGSADFGGTIFWLGTDGLGRDVLSSILYGLRISLAVGALSSVFALIIGTLLGLTGAYVGGRFDSFVMRLVDLQMSFPAILIALILLAVLGRGVDKTMIALVAVQWAYYARIVRGSALVEREREYIEAAKCLRLGHVMIIWKHLLPNCTAPLLVIVTVQMAHAITLEATLSFLGVGLPETQPSLGLLIANGYQYLLSGSYWISIFPGVALLIVIMLINLIGDRLRDILNPGKHR